LLHNKGSQTVICSNECFETKRVSHSKCDRTVLNIVEHETGMSSLSLSVGYSQSLGYFCVLLLVFSWHVMGQTATPAHTPVHNTGCKARFVITGTVFIVGLMDILTGTAWTVRCSNVGREKEVFLFSKTSRPALGPIQPLI
jgi:hypothetical protein